MKVMRPALQIITLFIVQMIFGAAAYIPKVLCMSGAERYRNERWTRDRFRLSFLVAILGLIVLCTVGYIAYVGQLSEHGKILGVLIGGFGCFGGIYLICWQSWTFVEIDGDRVTYRNEWDTKIFEMTNIVHLHVNWGNIEVTLKDRSVIKLPIQLRKCGRLLAILRNGSGLKGENV